jgi:CheY-like chemotaxis protein
VFKDAPALSGSALSGLCVLVVDDNFDTLTLLATVLGIYGARVLAASSAAEALEVVERDRPDVLVSDINMPYEDGFSLLRKVRAKEAQRGGRLPALAFTGYTDLFDSGRTRAAGFEAHLAKPVEPDVLVHTVARLAGR